MHIISPSSTQSRRARGGTTATHPDHFLGKPQRTESRSSQGIYGSESVRYLSQVYPLRPTISMCLWMSHATPAGMQSPAVRSSPRCQTRSSCLLRTCSTTESNVKKRHGQGYPIKVSRPTFKPLSIVVLFPIQTLLHWGVCKLSAGSATKKPRANSVASVSWPLTPDIAFGYHTSAALTAFLLS